MAVANTLTRNATPLTTLAGADGRPDWIAISRLIGEWRPALLVVGVPYNADGTETELGREAARFARRLEGRFGVPAAVIDERLSSAEAGSRLREARSEGTRRRRVDKQDVDRLSAAVILQTWLDNNA